MELVCDKNQKEPTLTTTGDSGIFLTYVRKLLDHDLSLNQK